MKSGNLNFLEPSGPLQAWNGTPHTPKNGLEIMVKQISLDTKCAKYVTGQGDYVHKRPPR